MYKYYKKLDSVLHKKLCSYADSQHSHTGTHSAALSNKNILSPASFENMTMTFMNLAIALKTEHVKNFWNVIVIVIVVDFFYHFTL